MEQSIAIVGGGIIGFTIAEHLIQAGYGPVTLFDRDLAGQGASARSAGLHFPLGRNAPTRALAARSQRAYEAEIECNPDGPIRRLDMRVHLDPDTDAAALDVFLDSAKLVALPGPGPLLQADRVRSWQVQGAHHCHLPAWLAQLVQRVAHRLSLREGCRVEHIGELATAVQLHLGDGTVHAFDRLILAPGPWALEAPFAALTGSLGMRIKKIVAFHIDAPCGPDDAAEMFLSADAFLLPVPAENRWIFSYTCDEWDVSPTTLPFGVSARDRAAAQAILARYMPAWAERLHAGRVFCDAYHPGRTPLACIVGNSGRIVFAGAANGAGYRLAPALAERVAHTLGPIN